MSLENYQNQLNTIDNKIIELIEKRYLINKILKKFIKKNKLDINFGNLNKIKLDNIKLENKKISKLNLDKLFEILSN